MKAFASLITSKKDIKSLTIKLKEATKEIDVPIFHKSKSTNALTDCDKRSHSVQPRINFGFSSEKRDSPKTKDGLTLQDRIKTVPVCQYCLKKINTYANKKITKNYASNKNERDKHNVAKDFYTDV